MPDRRLSVQGCIQNLPASLPALRDLARGTSQLNLRVAWTPAFKQSSLQNLGYPMTGPWATSWTTIFWISFNSNKMH